MPTGLRIDGRTTGEGMFGYGPQFLPPSDGSAPKEVYSSNQAARQVSDGSWI